MKNNEEYIKERKELINKIQDMLFTYVNKYGEEKFVTLMFGFFLETIDVYCDLDDDKEATFRNPIRDITIHPVHNNNHNKGLN